MGEKVANGFYLSHQIQVYKWYADPLHCKTKPMVVAMITVVQIKLYVDLADDFQKYHAHMLLESG